MTLIEMLIVMSLILLVSGAVVMGSGQLSGARLKQSAALLTGAVKVAYTRATATSKVLRLVMDFDTETVWLEESSTPALVQMKDATGTGGADPVTAAEQAAVLEGARIIKGPPIPRPHFSAITSGEMGEKDQGGKFSKPLARGIKFREVQTGHDEAPRTTGRGYLYFWPGGQTERASIQVHIGDSAEDAEILTLLVSPLTGKVTIKSGPVAVSQPADDKEASEREDRGGP
jgi:general secretion pathway protein H